MSKETILLKLRIIMPLLFAIAALGWLGFFIMQPFDGKVSDFPQYYTPTRLMMTGQGAFAYDIKKVGELEQQCFPGMGARVQPSYLPPPSLAWLLPLGLLPSDVAHTVWRVLQGLALAGSVLMLRSAFQLSSKACLWLVAVMCASGPAFTAIQIEQVSPIILFALCATIWGFKKDKPWVVVLALSLFMMKPQQALPVLTYLIGARRYKPVLMMLPVVATLSLIVCALIGQQGLYDYMHIASSFDSEQFLQAELGPTLRGQLLRLAPDSKPVIAVVSALASLAALGFIFISGRRFASQPAWLEAGLLIAVPLGLVTCFYFHSYDLLLLTPAVVIILAGPLEMAIPPLLLLLGFVLFGTLMVPFFIFIHHYYLLKTSGGLNPHFFTVLIFAVSAACLPYRYPDKLSAQSESKTHD